ncbi:MAG: multidrug efflux RND transporter permease subunit [Desulfobacteraceae bacterium]|nr:multidrug efflux RND transporter permease subunit [Desulfobacteraceae bacterium]
MFVNFFIRRPIFSGVIAIVIVIAGAVCIPALPVAQFPEIAPPTVQVTTTYTGAAAEVVERTVTQPIEEQVNGVEGMTYMYSNSSSDGTMKLTVTFDVGYNLQIAAVDVQNRVAIALPQVPEEVRRYGVTTKKLSTNFLLVVNLIAKDKNLDAIYLSNYANINLVDALKRIPGVGDVQILGERKYSMRAWLDPDKLTGLGLTCSDVVKVIREQNLQVPAGQIGQPPSPPGQAFTYSITALGRLSKVSQFEDIIVRTRPDGSVVRLKDVARIELGAENYDSYGKLNGAPSTTIGVFLLPGSNALDTSKQVRGVMKRSSKRFPKGVEYTIVYDTTLFVDQSIEEVIKTLVEALFLVFMVVYVFLQNFRSTIIPAITIPVSLVGTFAVMMALGFSINTLTLFGLVLAIGLVVDDAIVVVENISRLIEEEGMGSMEAAIEGMREVVGPIIATTLVLMAVFVPVAFMPGTTGQLYKQFALTIAISVGISAINALTLSPALCAILLRPEKKHGWFFRNFNQAFNWCTNVYIKWVRGLIKLWVIVVLVFIALLGVTYYLFHVVPTGFVPDEDQGYFFVFTIGPEGSSLERTGKVATKVEEILSKTPGVADVLTIGGFDLINNINVPNTSTIIVVLKPWGERKTAALSADGIMASIRKQTAGITEAMVAVFNAPPIQGLSQTGGFEFELQDLTGGSLDTLSDVTQKMIQNAAKEPALVPLTTNFAVNFPQFYIDLDRTKAKTLDVDISDIFDTLQTYLGALYVNDFNKFGRIYRVYAQAEKDFRSKRLDISKLYVRSRRGEMVPLSALIKVKQIRGVQTVKHYNIYRTAAILGGPAPGYSSGQAIETMERIAEKVLPDDYGYEWTGVAYEEKKAGGQAPVIFGLALVFVFLFLAAQYESWTLPLIIMLAVPLAILGALLAQSWRGLVNDVYCQIGLVMLIGLASKNAILIVEFAKEKREQGASVVEAALEASRLRLRPILMTAFAFIFGVVPLVVARGAGAASRHSLGTAVFGGMIASTFLSLVLVPVLFVIIEKIRERGQKGRGDPNVQRESHPPEEAFTE